MRVTRALSVKFCGSFFSGFLKIVARSNSATVRGRGPEGVVGRLDDEPIGGDWEKKNGPHKSGPGTDT